MSAQLAGKGYCYFAVDRLDNGMFIGFIGLSEPRFETDFTPCVDMGWRLKQSEWGRGFATEGARACLDYGFKELGLEKIVAIAPCVNMRSVEVMKKIGMTKVMEFMHPLLIGDELLERCVLYEINNEQIERRLRNEL
jgi:RimJ/RimL family protein N-acetyltransferase